MKELNQKVLESYAKLVKYGACTIHDIPFLYRDAVADYLGIPRPDDN